MAKPFKDYVDSEKKPNKDELIQARITPEMAEQVQALCKLNGWKPSYVVRGGIRKFLDDCSPKEPSSFQLRKVNLDPEPPAIKKPWKPSSSTESTTGLVDFLVNSL